MRHYLFFVVLFACQSLTVFGQNAEGLEGRISYVNSNSVYVKFNSTESIQTGDTLFVQTADGFVPALVVKHKSSISCVCESIVEQAIEPGLQVQFRRRTTVITSVEAVNDSVSVVSIDTIPPVIFTPEPDLPELKTFDQSIRGRLGISWYGNFYDRGLDDVHRMRYVLTLNAQNIAGSKFSAETYLSFRHTLGEWDEVRANFHRSFKAYNLSVSYQPNPTLSFALGRKINRYISNIGAIDGLQAHKRFSRFSVGTFAGFRPDHSTYRLNTDLLQFGAYGVLDSRVREGTMQNTLAIVQQFRKSYTDRRFLYFQHTNSIFKKVFVFTSFEFDLYEKVNGEARSTLRLSSLYVSARYRASRKFSLFASYDARNNVIYYETYRNSVDQLIDQETRQGLRLRLNIRPVKKLSIGVSGGYRFQATAAPPARNLYGYISYSQIPWIKATISANTTYLKTNYLEGNVYGVRLSRDIVKGKVFGDIQYRFVNYRYSTTGTKLKQNIAGVNITWKIYRRTSMSFFYEGLFSSFNDYNRLHLNLTYRF